MMDFFEKITEDYFEFYKKEHGEYPKDMAKLRKTAKEIRERANKRTSNMTERKEMKYIDHIKKICEMQQEWHRIADETDFLGRAQRGEDMDPRLTEAEERAEKEKLLFAERMAKDGHTSSLGEAKEYIEELEKALAPIVE